MKPNQHNKNTQRAKPGSRGRDAPRGSVTEGTQERDFVTRARLRLRSRDRACDGNFAGFLAGESFQEKEVRGAGQAGEGPSCTATPALPGRGSGMRMPSEFTPRGSKGLAFVPESVEAGDRG